MAAAQPPIAAPQKPSPARVYAFIDGMNLFNWAKRCFEYDYPNYDIARLVNAVVALEADRQLAGAFFCVGVPQEIDDAKRSRWWNKKLAALGRSGVRVASRKLKRRELKIHLEGVVNFEHTVPRLVEKGIDLKIGLELVKLANERAFDVAVLFSQDGDLVEAVQEVRRIAREQRRWIQLECAYPIVAGIQSWPIKGTVPRQITKIMYDACIDPTYYG